MFTVILGLSSSIISTLCSKACGTNASNEEADAECRQKPRYLCSRGNETPDDLYWRKQDGEVRDGLCDCLRRPKS